MSIIDFLEYALLALLVAGLIFGVCAFFVALTYLQVKDEQKEAKACLRK